MNPITAFIDRITGKAGRKAKADAKHDSQERANDAMKAMFKR